MAISAPAFATPGAKFRVDIEAPVGSRTAYVYWQRRDGQGWKTFAVTTDGPEERNPHYIELPLTADKMPTVDLMFPQTNHNPTFQMTIAPTNPGHYRILKAFLPPGEPQRDEKPTWAAYELDVRAQ